MAEIGVLGDKKSKIVFTVTPKVVRTFRNFKHTSSARYAVHNRHLRAPLPERTGRELDKITFSMTLSAHLGVNPRKDLSRLQGMLRNGRVLSLSFGRSQINGSKWVIQSLNCSYEQFDKTGQVISAEVSITLLEYPERQF
jgi:phage protein U